MAKASIGSLIRIQLSDLRKEIGQHEKALRALKKKEKDLRQAARLLSGKGAAAGARKKGAAGRKTKGKKTKGTKAAGTSRRTNWEATVKKLPATFTMNDLAGTRGARGKSRAYLHQIINRWKKAGVIKSAGRAKYQKV
ncbi:MAG: hypothetical protein ACE5IM_00515 [Nitrospinota bacterium]